MLTPDGTHPNVEIIMPDALAEKDRRELADQRKADLAADKTERFSLWRQGSTVHGKPFSTW